eukprot:gene3864-4815_t
MDNYSNFTSIEWYNFMQNWRTSKVSVPSQPLTNTGGGGGGNSNANSSSSGSVSTSGGNNQNDVGSGDGNSNSNSNSVSGGVGGISLSSVSATSSGSTSGIIIDGGNNNINDPSTPSSSSGTTSIISDSTGIGITLLPSASTLNLPSFNTISGFNNNDNNSNSNNNASPYIILDSLLKSLKTEKDDILRINLLVFLQENSTILLEDDYKRFERTHSILQSLTTSQIDSYPVKCQSISTITTILITESTIKTHPRIVENFINLLFDIISRINNSPDRLLRGSSCLCLLEFELTYPCLLSAYIPLLLNYCQSENTHLIQSYTLLLSTILQNTFVNDVQNHSNRQQVGSGNSSNSSGVGGNNIPISFPISPTYYGSLSSTPSSMPSPHSSYSSLKSIQVPGPTMSGGVGGQHSLTYRKSLSRTPSSSALLNIYTDEILSSTQNSSSNTAAVVSGISSLSGVGGPNTVISSPPSFTIPHNVKYSPLAITNIQNTINHHIKLPENIEKDVFRCASTIADQSPYLNQWGLSTIISKLIPLIDIANIPHNFFRNHLHLLYKQLFTNNPLQFHLILYLAIKYPSLYSQDEFEICLKRIIYIINDISILALKETKLYALCKCLLSSTVQSPPPKDLLKSLICIDEFRYQNEGSQHTKVVFSIILLFLSSFPSSIFKNIEGFLSEILIQYPQFLNSLIGLLNGITDKKTRINLFLSLSKVIIPLKPLRFLQYLPLVERMVLEDSIDPSILLYKTYDLVRRKTICKDGNWYIGNIILSICRRVLIFHHTSPLFKPLRLIFSNLAYYFSNLEIRDRASFYEKLLTHLSDDKIKALLIHQTPQNDDSNSISGIVSSSSTSSSEKSNTIKSVSQFISIVPLKKSIRHSFNLDNGNGNQSVGAVDDYQNYLSMIKDSDQLNAKIIISHQIRYKRNIPLNGIPLKIYALLLQLQQSPFYAQIHPVRIPYLCHPQVDSNLDQHLSDSSNSSSSSNLLDNSGSNVSTSGGTPGGGRSQHQEFPYCYDVDLSFRPLYPIPTSFSVKMVFNDDEGKTCKADGSLITIQFHELFTSVPIPPSISTDKATFLTNLFESLWSSIPVNDGSSSVKLCYRTPTTSTTTTTTTTRHSGRRDNYK